MDFIRASVDRLRRQDARGVFGVVAADARALRDLGAGLDYGFAHLRRDQRGQVVPLMFEEVCELAHAERAVGEWDLRVVSEGGGRGADLLQQRAVSQGGKAAQQNAVRGIDGLDRH